MEDKVLLISEPDFNNTLNWKYFTANIPTISHVYFWNATFTTLTETAYCTQHGLMFIPSTHFRIMVMVSLRSLPWKGSVPVNISNCRQKTNPSLVNSVLCLRHVTDTQSNNELVEVIQLTMSTPYDHQSALWVWPRRFTTSGAMYSTVPQNE